MNLLVDCSHGNSRKDYKNQPDILNYLININNDFGLYSPIIGFMIESNLNEENRI